MREKYHDEGLPMTEIAELAGCSDDTIRFWRDRHGLEKVEHRGAHKKRDFPVFGHTSDDRYERVVADEKLVRIHRLAAVAWFGLEAVRGREAHHENGVPWDNRESNLRLYSTSEHAEEHAKDRPPEALERERDPDTGRFVSG